jgi:hypothetical protein
MALRLGAPVAIERGELAANNRPDIPRQQPGGRDGDRLFDAYQRDTSPTRWPQRGEETRGAHRVRRAIEAEDEGTKLARPMPDDQHWTRGLPHDTS